MYPGGVHAVPVCRHVAREMGIVEGVSLKGGSAPCIRHPARVPADSADTGVIAKRGRLSAFKQDFSYGNLFVHTILPTCSVGLLRR